MTSNIIEKLQQAVGSERVNTEESVMQERRHDYSVPSKLDDIKHHK